MENTKHTPGPWEVQIGIDPTGFACYFIGRISRPFISRAEEEANARLIAAAPDLLEALEYAYSLIVGDLGDRRYLGSREDIIADKIEKAISKAKGE